MGPVHVLYYAGLKGNDMQVTFNMHVRATVVRLTN
jgi:hypothetical protein